MIVPEFQRSLGTTLTVSGAVVDLTSPKPWMFRFTDIAHSLARVCRYGGHVGWIGDIGSTFYSVAEHSVLLTDWCRDQGLSERVQRAALMHDAAEAYLGDMPTPLKKILPDYQRVELRVERAIQNAFGVVGRNDIPVLAEADRAIQADEIAALRPYAPMDAGEGLGVRIRELVPAQAYSRFVAEGERLGLS